MGSYPWIVGGKVVSSFFFFGGGGALGGGPALCMLQAVLVKIHFQHTETLFIIVLFVIMHAQNCLNSPYPYCFGVSLFLDIYSYEACQAQIYFRTCDVITCKITIKNCVVLFIAFPGALES